MVDIERLFPVDPDVTERDIKAALGGPDHIRRNTVMTGVVITGLLFEILRRHRPFSGIHEEDE